MDTQREDCAGCKTNPPPVLPKHHSGPLQTFLSKLGLVKFYPNKLTLQSLLEINKDNISDRDVESIEAIPWCFLRKLLKINAECRNCTSLSNADEKNNEFEIDLFTAEEITEDNEVNPLDLITALFLCADSLLQQEMALKMSMCQFSVPLLLPCNKGNSQSTLMLWSLRDILKEWRPHVMSESKGFVETNIVNASIPLISFVRLKNCGLSKSQLLNHVLSSGQQHHNIFIHGDMEGGAAPRKIANGLVEVCWYLPCGKEKLDIFPEPIAFANLRGDVCASIAQFRFLSEVSTAIFIFLDKVEETEHKALMSFKDARSKIFLVVNRKKGDFHDDMKSVKETIDALKLEKSNVKVKDQLANIAEFSKKLGTTIKMTLTDEVQAMAIEAMYSKAIEFGLTVDQCKSEPQMKAAEEIMETIGVCSISDYKKQQLPLQGNHWKKLAQLEKEECRLQKSGDLGLEEYKSQLEAEKNVIRKEQSKYKLTKAMDSFIASLATTEKEKRDIFLKWMKLKLDAHSRNKLSELRKEFKEQCKKKDREKILELDQTLMDSSLGLENYMRELGQIYEVSFHCSKKPTDEISNLPVLAAEMLLDGYPLELLDGDSSNIPERWVEDVLMELHKKVGGRSRLLVLTVLGVQSTGKSTLLNTMFGVQFPVSSGRCTRGAFMLFIRVGEDMQHDLNCDFILLIDTEGLKSPDLAQLDDSYEHDNQLATLVIGLSDVTIINIAMENSTEMKDILQIAAHAFLRMKVVGKKPVCHFVHQNVAGVSAHAKNMTDRKHLLDQLNEMTQMAAEMEKQPSIQKFTDVLDYDLDKNNWYIPGLWHGTPPMAPVNTGYSEAVSDFKNNLLGTLKSNKNVEISQIPDFLKWMSSLWKAVKYENFIFSFRNTLVARAYDNLCKEFSEWEWAFRKEVLSWQTTAELEISSVDNESDIQSLNMLVASKQSEASKEIGTQEAKMTEKLQDYYRRKDCHVNLIAKYKADFINSIKSLKNEITHSVKSRLEFVLELKICSKKVQDLQRQTRCVIEEQIMKLLSSCKNAKSLSDEQLREEFEKMWDAATVNISGLKEQDIPACIRKQLTRNLSNLNVNEEMEKVEDLCEMGNDSFQANSKHMCFWGKITNVFLNENPKGNLQNFADNVIASCIRYVLDTVKSNKDYHDTFAKELLEKIDEFLQQNSCLMSNTKFEVDLKLHICGIASREFLKMHRKFLKDNHPESQLEKYKTQYLSDFLDLYKDRDHCQRKATDLVQFCIRPAVENYISRSLGIDIVDDILTSSHSAEYSSRSYFQYCIQKDLLNKGDFECFVKYIGNNEMYVKDWILEHIRKKLSEDKTVQKLKNNSLKVIIKKTTETIEQASTGKNGLPLPDNNESITVLINNMRTHLLKDMSISMEAVKGVLFQIKSTCHPFTKSLTESLNDLKEQLEQEFSKAEDIETLSNLPIRPQDELFKRVFGCGQQCPFCKVPCEAGGKEHRQHHATVHRPQGLGGYRWNETGKLSEGMCTTCVYSDTSFSNTMTNGMFHPYKEYHTYYPDWNIPPDPSIEASDYWKYVLVTYNDRLAKRFEAKPADVPNAWKSITKVQALEGLDKAFNVK